MRVVRRDAHPVRADETRRRLDLGLAAFDGGPAVAPEVLLGQEREIRRVRVAVLGIVPFDAREEARRPGVLRLEEAHAELGVELEHAAHDHRNEGLLHLDPVAGHVTVEAVLPVERVHVRIPRARPLVEAPRDVELLVHAVERIPVVRVPVVAVDQVRPHERPDRAEVLDTAEQLGARQVDLVRGQHRHELELVRARLAELVDPVVVGLAEREGELGVHAVAGEKAQSRRRVEHRDVHAFHLHARQLRLRVIVALDREIETPRVGQARARERLGAVRAAGLVPLAVLLQLGVHGRRQAVDHDGAPLGATVGAERQADAAPEGRIEIRREEVRRLHDVHVAIDEPEPVLHDVLL